MSKRGQVKGIQTAMARIEKGGWEKRDAGGKVARGGGRKREP